MSTEEDFNVNYYAHHVKLMMCLINNKHRLAELSLCEEEFSKVTTESLFRDLSSRAYYTVLLKISDTLGIIGRVDHTTHRDSLSRKFKQSFKELKEIRELADYKSGETFVNPIKTAQGTQYYAARIIATMDEFLAADYNKLTP